MTDTRLRPDFLTELFSDALDPAYAAAAARRDRQGAAERRLSLVLRVVTLVAVGFLLAVAYRQAVAAEPESERARAGLVDEVRDRRADTDRLQTEADRLREEVARQRDAALAGSEVAQLRNLEAATGLGKVSGDGAVVRVADAPGSVDPVTGKANANLGQVHDRDLQSIVNALWESGAEAVAVNGQRLTATSTIRLAGSAILVDFRPVSSPYEITAIGPDSLARDFENSPTGRRFKRYIGAYGMGFEVKPRSDLTLPAAADPQLRYATPLHPTPTPSATGGR
ncbi:MAG TPA: DUF881 domain-containing protein [Micromonosporaceae bacterium]|nr:DUF881 domain-containing protein [Micromonosporaceae bacterium]